MTSGQVPFPRDTQILKLDSLTKCCSAQHLLLYSTGIFLPRASGVNCPHCVSVESILLYQAVSQDQEESATQAHHLLLLCYSMSSVGKIIKSEISLEMYKAALKYLKIKQTFINIAPGSKQKSQISAFQKTSLRKQWQITD